MLGFLSVATRQERPERRDDDVFQSRAGFSLRRDSIVHTVASTTAGFNPVLGFLSVATESVEMVRNVDVSFNPVLGFLSVATVAHPPRSLWEFGFNPVLGFLSVATGCLVDVDALDTFQSRAGFSLRRDKTN